VVLSGCASPRVAPSINPTAIRSVKIGMTEQHVTAILGQPLRIRPWGPGAVIYDYAVPGWAVWSPELWIQFERGSVRTVHGKRHRLIGDDRAVYEARADRATFESPDFERTFNRGR
jgi:hypothetical protein